MAYANSVKSVDAATETTTGDAVDCPGLGMALFDVNLGAGTVQFEGRGPAGDWRAIGALSLTDLTTIATTTTADGFFRTDCSGLDSVRASVTVHGSGTHTVWIAVVDL